LSSSTASPSYLPKRGSINLVVISPPTTVNTNTETILKNQLYTGVTVIVSSIIAAASVEIPASNASVPATNKFAVKPAPAPAYPAANPASGCLPILKNTIAANGGIRTIAASEAKFPKIPTNTTVYVIKTGGDFSIVL